MPLAFCDLIEECIHHRIKKSVTNFRKPWTETGNNAETPYHWRDLHLLAVSLAGCKFVTTVCRAILAEFKDEYLRCPDSLDEWKRVEEKFRTKWNVPHAIVALDGKHISMKKPKKSGSDGYNYKDFFSLVLLALVNAEYKFLWIDLGQVVLAQLHRFSSFNRSNLR